MVVCLLRANCVFHGPILVPGSRGSINCVDLGGLLAVWRENSRGKVHNVVTDSTAPPFGGLEFISISE